MSIRSPLNNPIHSPSFLPRINPNDDTAIINRFGDIPAIAKDLNKVVCNTKHIVIMMNNTILRLIMLLYPTLLWSVSNFQYFL